MSIRRLLVLAACLPLSLPAQIDHRAGWWKSAVFYEIYPRSFQDSNGDGAGDLKGIADRLPYLEKLGAGAIWITPFYPSPQVDFGYDIADYENVDPQFGTLADADRLIAAAHAHHIRVIMDMVLNHTSDKHPYFIQSRSSKTSPYRDWYIWRDGKNGGPPNNWSSGFGPTAWTLDPATGQYYYHYFYAEQPDLNWRNPKVQAALFNSVRFWLKRGVDGFRLDALDQLFEDPDLHDNPILPGMRDGSQTEHAQEEKYNRDLPESHRLLQDLRKVMGEFGPDRVLIGEIWVPTIQQLTEYYGPSDNEIQLPFNFFFTKVPKLDAALFRDKVAETERVLKGHWTTWVLSNHDIVRALSRYGDGQHNDAIQKLLGMLLLTLRGSPFIYYGEELGMVNNDPKSVDEVRDPVGRRYWPVNIGRDGERTPMQWTGDLPKVGFTTGTPWLPAPASAVTHNVSAESTEGESVLSFYERLTAIRRSHPALLSGEYAPLGDDPAVFAYRRFTASQNLAVALNMSAEEKTIALPSAGKILARNLPGGRDVENRELILRPYEAALIGLH